MSIKIPETVTECRPVLTEKHITQQQIVHPVILLSQTVIFRCDCGASTVMVRYLPHRCRDCGEWYWTVNDLERD